MEKNNRKSKSYNKKKISILKSGNRQSKIITQKEALENGITRIFSSPPSHLGYKNDIESLLNELGIKMEELLYLTISSLSKVARTTNEIKIIASYLYLMPDIIKLIKGKDLKKKEQHILKDIINLSESMTYEKYQKNFILMKFGDIGSTAYVILDGQVDVLIKSFKNINISKFDYLFYLATLLKYSEFGLLNEAINENFSIFPLQIYNDTNQIHFNLSSSKEHIKIEKKNNNNNPINQKYQILSNKNEPTSLEQHSKINIIENNNKNDDSNNNSNNNKYNDNSNSNNKNFSSNSLFKLNEENKEIKEFKKVYKISISNLMEMFNLKMEEKKNLMFCNLNDYVNRIELIPDDYKNYIKKIYLKKNKYSNQKEIKKDNKKENNKDNNEDNEEDFNNIFNFKIFSYSKVTSLGKGTLFGEIALSDANSLRTGTIITSSDCHCSILNKKTFDHCLKRGAEKYLKELLNFFIELPIFNGIAENVFYHKYYTFLSKKNMLRGKDIITQGEKPENIIILQTGSYGLTTRISMFDLTKLIYHFIKLNLNNRNLNDIFDEEIRKYKRLLKKISKIMNEAKSMMNENLKFKKFYISEVFIRVTDITCPDIVGSKEYIDENGLYAFTIETKSPENIIYILENKIYSELQKNVIVKKNQKELLEKKLNVMIQRLLIIRNSLVNSFFDSKSEKEVSSIVLKELENISISKLKQKRFLKFKSIEYKINKKALDGKDNDNNKNNGSDKESIKLNRIRKLSRNYKINKNIDFYSSYNNKNELNQNFSMKKISLSYNININKIRPKTNNKINTKIINVNKIQRNFLSAKKIEDKDINKNKNFLIEIDNSKEKHQFSQTLKEMNSDFKIKQNNQNSSKYIDEEESNKKEKLFLLHTPKINSANNLDENYQTKRILMNNLVWEEIKSKIRKKINLNNYYYIKNRSSTYRNKKFINLFEKSNSFKINNLEENKMPFTSGRFTSSKIKINKRDNNLKFHFINNPILLCKSSSELLLKKNFIIKPNNKNDINIAKKMSRNNLSEAEEYTDNTINNNIINIYNISPSKKKDLIPKINLKIKKMFSPEEINFIRYINKKRNALNIIKYLENKCEKYRLDRNIYYNNNLKNIIKLFYINEKVKIKI